MKKQIKNSYLTKEKQKNNTYNFVSKYLSYDQHTGTICWIKKFNKASKIKIGDVAGGVQKNGYRMITFNLKSFNASRLAWLLFYKNWPSNYIDHINGIRSDNRINNLRDCTQRENQQNLKTHRSGKLIGAHYDKRSNVWYSEIYFNKKRNRLGTFASEELANEAYLKALNKLSKK